MTGCHDEALRGPHSVLTSTSVAHRRPPDAERNKTMGIIAWIVVGAIAGFIATRMLGMMDGIVTTILLGIVGAVVGGLLAGIFLNLNQPTGINLVTIIVSVIGAVIVVYVANMIEVRRRRTV
jgi:uncharacterized membrane protein YeaQ/YmgE (transglycosylase-associated protein family)